MRQAFATQLRLDGMSIGEIPLNVECRDEIVPILAGLQHIYSQPELRAEILRLIARDVNRQTREDCGREGLDYWQILVLACVRLGCNLDYDRLQDLAEQHRTLRLMMGLGDWQAGPSFNWRRIRDNICLLQPETIEQISHHLVAAGHCLAPDAARTVRADSFVLETNIHYPTESTLIRDGLRKLLELCATVSNSAAMSGWRQHAHLFRRIKQRARRIDRIAARKGANYKPRLQQEYRKLLKLSRRITSRVRELCAQLAQTGRDTRVLQAALRHYLELTEQVLDTARRRVIHGETVPNPEKLFSLFEPHTQLYKRGKAGRPVQFGRLALVYEDGAGFVTHHYLLPRECGDEDVVVEQTRLVQARLGGAIEQASFDRGFHTPENQIELAKIVRHPCLPKPGVRQAAEQERQASVQFRAARQRHPGVESAIGALQAGNGLARCRDRTELGCERYLALGVLGRNLHVLGLLVLQRNHQLAQAARRRRRAVRVA